MASTPKKAEQTSIHSAVADSIVKAFIETLGAEEGMAPVAKRLSGALLEKHSYSETSLRNALFEDETP